MNKARVIRNGDLRRVSIGVPGSHKHLRICLELKKARTLVFQEPTVANILRPYTTMKTHPSFRARELKMETLTAKQPKEGYAKYQLLETPQKKDEENEKELSEPLKQIFA